MAIEPLTLEQISNLRKLYAARMSKSGMPPLVFGRALQSFDSSVETFQRAFTETEVTTRCHLCRNPSAAGIYAGRPRRWICSNCLQV
jgi:hypothetical protein